MDLKDTWHDFHPSSRVWIYQSNRQLTQNECEALQESLDKFTDIWVSHDEQLKAKGTILESRFIVLMVDETQAGASGCSIDKSVQFVKNIEQTFNIDLFNRMIFSFRDDASGQVVTCSKDDFEAHLKKGRINPATKVFNTLVKTKNELTQIWELPLGESWHRRLFN